MALSDLIPWTRQRHVEPTRCFEDPFWDLHRGVNRIFEDFARSLGLAPGPGFEGSTFLPRIDVQETRGEILVTVEIPGMEEKDFEVTLADGVLTLKGQKRLEREETGEVHRLERAYGSFRRSLALPCEVDTERVRASYKNGVLTVALPLAAEARRRVHHIEVKSR